MDIKVGKNKYQITFPILVTVGAILVSAISWFTMLQVNMATMESELDRLSVIIEKQEDNKQVKFTRTR